MSELYIEGEKIALRGVTRADLDHIRRFWDNAEATRYMETGSRPATEVALEAFYRTATDNPTAVVFAVVERASNKIVGTSGLYEIFWPGRRAEFRILIGEPSVFDKGYGTEATRLTVDYAFIRLNMEVVHLGVNADNVRAVKAYEKAGFVREGLRRRFVYARGTYHDAVVMSVIRDEFLKARRP